MVKTKKENCLNQDIIKIRQERGAIRMKGLEKRANMKMKRHRRTHGDLEKMERFH